MIVLLAALVMMVVEVKRPGRRWPEVTGWWTRAVVLNVFQAITVVFAGWLVTSFLNQEPVFAGASLGPVLGAFWGYLVLTFVFYWWHRARHENAFLWRWFHQIHHAPQRLEILTSFYKHPLEVLANAAISAVVMFWILGLSHEAALGATLLAGLAELFYHWNVRTPRWVGYFLQRPESHCVHHEQGIHQKNYGDLPVWDMLFGTFHNPPEFDGACGFGELEAELGPMLAGVDVFDPQPIAYRGRLMALTALGLMGMTGHAFAMPALKGLAAVTAAAPAPKVFTSHEGLETFSTKFSIQWVDLDGAVHDVPLDSTTYERVGGPYNRRNMYGAVLAYGPVLASQEATREMFYEVARYGLCPSEGGVILQEVGLDLAQVREVRVMYEPLPGTASRLPRVIEPCAQEQR